MEAAKAGSLQLVKAILKKGGNPNALDRKRLTAVHYAAMGGFFEVLFLLTQCHFFTIKKMTKWYKVADCIFLKVF